MSWRSLAQGHCSLGKLETATVACYLLRLLLPAFPRWIWASFETRCVPALAQQEKKCWGHPEKKSVAFHL